MSYSDPRICHHQRVTQWLAAMRQHAAWLYAADEQYLYLVAEANELYQCGVVLSPELAREWLDPATPPERAEQILLNQGEPSESFTWYPVSRDVGNVRNQGPQLIEPQRSAS